tara:strand:- start:774 stop:968 length:195 start_codon:yes stop_codon:yes gene_type:complete
MTALRFADSPRILACPIFEYLGEFLCNDEKELEREDRPNAEPTFPIPLGIPRGVFDRDNLLLAI